MDVHHFDFFHVVVRKELLDIDRFDLFRMSDRPVFMDKENL